MCCVIFGIELLAVVSLLIVAVACGVLLDFCYCVLVILVFGTYWLVWLLFCFDLNFF